MGIEYKPKNTRHTNFVEDCRKRTTKTESFNVEEYLFFLDIFDFV